MAGIYIYIDRGFEIKMLEMQQLQQQQKYYNRHSKFNNNFKIFIDLLLI
jgi:hypothetical protein